MDVLVTGGTGFIGSKLCRELADRGHHVTALARNPNDDGVPEGVTAAVGDVTALDSIREHFEGMDVVVNLVSLSPLFRPKGGKSHMGVHYEGTKNVLAACEEHGVPRIVQMSGPGADPDAPTEYLRAKGLAEEAVRDSGLDYVIFRPSVVFGDGAEFLRFSRLVAPWPVAPLPGGDDVKFQPIWVGDLAPMMADAVEDDAYEGDYDIAGPETLTLEEVTRLAWREKGKSITLLPMPMALADVGLTVLGAVGGPLGADQARSLKLDLTIADNDIDAFGVDEADLTTLEDYVGVELSESDRRRDRGVPTSAD